MSPFGSEIGGHDGQEFNVKKPEEMHLNQELNLETLTNEDFSQDEINNAKNDRFADSFKREGFPTDRQPTVEEARKMEAFLHQLQVALGYTQPTVETGTFSKEFKEGQRHYEFFSTKREREELYQYSAAIAEKLHKDDVADLVVMDRSSRPLYVGVREYWKAAYPNQRMPGMYFLNPKGFQSRSTLNPMDVFALADRAYMQNDLVEDDPNVVPTHEAVLAEFQNKYKALLRDRRKPVMLFDSCFHSGRTMAPVVGTLKEAGFENLIVASVNPSDKSSAVKTDFYITKKPAEKQCYPFDEDQAINKVFGSSSSVQNKNPMAIARARRLRQEIKLIMQEQIAKNHVWEDKSHVEDEPS